MCGRIPATTVETHRPVESAGRPGPHQEVPVTLIPIRRDGTHIYRVSPIQEFEDIYDRLGRLMNAVADPGFTQAAEAPPWLPAADLSETDDAYLIEVDLPGVDRADIDVQVEGPDLVVTGKTKESLRERLLRRGRRSGRFELRATLPGDIDPDRVEAHLSDGVLRVTAPKARAGGARHIQITD
jgi:HSP20 family protein